MKYFRLIIPIAILVSFAQAVTLEDYASGRGENGFYSATKVDMVKGTKKGEGPGPYLPALDSLPKRIGLISVYLKDLGNRSSKAYLPHNPTKISSLPKSNGNALAGFYTDQVIPALKKEFEARGSSLLTPADFLDSPQDIAYYDSFEPELGAMIKAGMKWHAKTLSLSGSPIAANAPGYQMLPMDLFANDKKAANSMNAICERLDLDAVIGIHLETRTTDKETALVQMSITMFGPNPVPESQRKGMAFLMYEGQPYGKASLRNLKGDLLQYKRGQKLKTEHDVTGNANSGFTHTTTTYYEKITTYASLEGMETITLGMMKKLLDRIENEIRK